MTALKLTEKAKKFMAMKPTEMFVVAGITFYEHPTRGDEAPFHFITVGGELKNSFFWEMPSVDDVIDAGFAQ